MIRSAIGLILFAGHALAQSRIELLQSVAQHYGSANSYEVAGTASALLPGTSWKVSYHFDAHGVQPAFLPLDVRTSSIQDFGTVGGGFTHTRTDPAATDPFPDTSFSLEMFGEYDRLAHRLTGASLTGKETISVGQHVYSCEVIDATFDVSPEFRAHSATEHRRFWIDPSQRIVLREQRSFSGMDWTAEVTSFSFDQPVSAESVKALRSMANQPKDRPEWVGRALPDLTLPQLSGPPIRLADLSGKPVLLDFWGSYCAPCKTATLHAQELARRYQTSGLTVITVTQDTAEDARLWAEHNHVNLPIVLDHDLAAFKALDVAGIPVVVLAGRDGRVLHYWKGLNSPEELDAAVAAALNGRSGAISSPTETQ